MMNGTMTQVVKQSLVYSYVLSQPFSVYVDAYPVLENNTLLNAEHIQHGEHGESVRVLQEKMNRLQYYDDDIDGEYGILTEHALKKIQAELDVDITGEADYQTLTGMIEMEKQKYLDQLQTMSEAVYPGMKSEDVKIVQQALHYFGYYTGEIDGLYGPLTEEAVKIAEDNHDIQLTPEVTKESVQDLYDSETKDETETTKTIDKSESGSESDSEEETPQEQAPNHNQQEDQNASQQEVSKNDSQQTKSKQITKSSNVFEQIAETAQSFIGTPYEWGGTSPAGFDCSGFIQYVFNSHDMEVPRTVNEMWNFASPVDKRSIGDLVFFETYKPGPSHMGVYIGDGRFVHAGESNGVAIGNLSDSYWEQRFIGTRRAQ